MKNKAKKSFVLLHKLVINREWQHQALKKIKKSRNNKFIWDLALNFSRTYSKCKNLHPFESHS